MRDPRIDPQPGDVVQNGVGKFWVTGRSGNRVYYRDTPPTCDDMNILLEEWQDNAKGDTIVEYGP